ncbi:caspase family protein [Caenimonas sedimenti]|uniref:Caspase family protein n=1 Tax=Caenimonas sedimenti TaxID=2596921 RepID=A0A562ZU67_9BURK|nr:caspase family protein [Caenimonas sedimenti]TWO71845.1 caspase family protein [Caenimonas sedimenti]
MAVKTGRARRAWSRGIAAWALVGFSASAQAPLDIRVALVIGNSAYPGAAALANPANDAAAMTASLRKLGFTVTELRDGSRDQMAQAITAVRDQLRGKQGVGMFYYAGHGLQLDWRNYMLPVDSRPTSAADVPAQAVNLDTVIEAFKAAGNRVNIVVLDACRDNPFGGAGSAKGLAQVDAPPGTFLAYATAPGNIADDGAESNGLYTGYLLQELAKPTARIEDVFKRVRLQVRQKSRGRQIPWESTSLEDDFVFNDGRAATVAAAPAAPPVPLSRATPAVREELFTAEKADWDRIKSSRNPDDYFSFLQKHPNGLISEAAQEKLDQLARPQVVASPVQGRAPIQRDPRVGDEIEYVYREGLTGLESRRETQRVTSIKDGIIEFNNGEQVITVGGGTIRNDQGSTFDPPLQVLPVGDFQIGRKWSIRSTQTLRNGYKGWVEQDMKVVAYEDVTIPVGTLKAYRIESSLRTQSGVFGTGTIWVNSNGAVVKLVRKARLPNGRDDSWTREVVRVHRPR